MTIMDNAQLAIATIGMYVTQRAAHPDDSKSILYTFSKLNTVLHCYTTLIKRRKAKPIKMQFKLKIILFK